MRSVLVPREMIALADSGEYEKGASKHHICVDLEASLQSVCWMRKRTADVAYPAYLVKSKYHLSHRCEGWGSDHRMPVAR